MSSRRTNLEIPEIEENLHSTSTTNTRNTTNDNEDNDVSTNNTNGSLNTTTTTVTLYSQVNHNEIETDPLLKRLYDSVDAMLRDQTLSQRNTQDNIVSKLFYVVMTAIEKNLSDQDSPFTRNSTVDERLRNMGNYSSFSSWINDSNLLPPTPSDLDIDDISLIDHAQNIYLKELEINQPTWFAAGSYT
ncbi:1509_t:CDS:2 [Diversispora eburnea]|uniref:1509_t:CDS:1 n=1 Tax=Diversispora eburnea TaxID=1213867 RepID=A0A9N9C4S9_9GLOM|nr:1509_t:CDS:2 [Diversispora eburnea]